MSKTKNIDPRTVERWIEDPTRSASATLGARMIGGEWTGSPDAIALGSSAATMSATVRVLREHGYTVQERSAGGSAKQWRIKPSRGGARARVATEVDGETHPHLGATLTVRALVLTDEGLQVQLANGDGSAWVATITGHVGAA